MTSIRYACGCFSLEFFLVHADTEKKNGTHPLERKYLMQPRAFVPCRVMRGTPGLPWTGLETFIFCDDEVDWLDSE